MQRGSSCGAAKESDVETVFCRSAGAETSVCFPRLSPWAAIGRWCSAATEHTPDFGLRREAKRHAAFWAIQGVVVAPLCQRNPNPSIRMLTRHPCYNNGNLNLWEFVQFVSKILKNSLAPCRPNAKLRARFEKLERD